MCSFASVIKLNIYQTISEGSFSSDEVLSGLDQTKKYHVFVALENRSVKEYIDDRIDHKAITTQNDKLQLTEKGENILAFLNDIVESSKNNNTWKSISSEYS